MTERRLAMIDEEIRRSTERLNHAHSLHSLESELFGASRSNKYLGAYVPGEPLHPKISEAIAKCDNLTEEQYRRFMETYCTATTDETNGFYWSPKKAVSFDRFWRNSRQKTHNIWIDDALEPGTSANIVLPTLETVLNKVGGTRNLSIHLIGHGTTPDYVHPKWISGIIKSNVKKGRPPFDFPLGFTIYKGGQKRVDITIHIDTEGRTQLYGMKFTPSNFVLLNQTVHLGNDLGLKFPQNKLLEDAVINSTEKLIQLPKNIASTNPKYGDAADMSLNQARLTLALAELEPKKQKSLGREAKMSAEGGLAYFEMANGADLDIFGNNWEGVGTNVLIQAFGAMLRLYRGDSALWQLLEFCIKYNITIVEAAVHDEIEDERKKISYGAFPDLTWGDSWTYPWMSPSTPFMRGGKNHFGLGYKLVMLAMDDRDGENNAKARYALGFNHHARPSLDPTTPDFERMCKYTGTLLFSRLLA
jgi:hypothetical protein